MSGQDIHSRIQEQLKVQLPERFYKNAAIEKRGNGFAITLDGREVKTTARKPLALPAEKLAGMIAAEWQAQIEFINPATMPMTRLANTAIDLVAGSPGPVMDEIANFAASDLICYRAQSPVGLVKRQSELWDPVLYRIEQKLGVKFKPASGISHIEQPQDALDAITRWLAGEGAFALAALHSITTLTGSALLAWALGAGGIPAHGIWQAAHIDEDWQNEQWGKDTEAAERMNNRQKEFMAAVDFLQDC